MNTIEALTQLRKQHTEELNIYWLEDIKDGDTEFWLDVSEDALDALCDTRWTWGILSRAEVDRGIRDDLVDYSDDEDECVIIVNDVFSEGVVKKAISEWLESRGFDFKINVIDPEGTAEMNRILAAVECSKSD